MSTLYKQQGRTRNKSSSEHGAASKEQATKDVGVPKYLTQRMPKIRMKAKLADVESTKDSNDISSFANNPVSRTSELQEQQADQIAEKALSSDGVVSNTALSRPSNSIQQTNTHNLSSVGLGSGRSLPNQTKTFFESRFNQNLDHIRIHSDPAAHQIAQGLNARAFTQGNHIGFDKSQYHPESSDGQRLLAHELAHTTQYTDSSKIFREAWRVNDRNREVKRQLLVQLIFENTWTDWWNNTGWTDTRINTFRSNFESSIESNFNNNAYVLKPPASANDVLPQENIDQGYKPKLDIQLVPNGDTSISEDWEVDVSSNPTGEFRTSSSNRRYGTLDEADNTPVAKASSAPGVTQVPAVHEFGHFIGLDHPGEGLDSDELSPGASEYGHTGTDAVGRTVDGPNDLMGGGMGHQPFYFDAWAEALDSHVSDLRLARQIRDIQQGIMDIFNPQPEMGDFPVPAGENGFA